MSEDVSSNESDIKQSVIKSLNGYKQANSVFTNSISCDLERYNAK